MRTVGQIRIICLNRVILPIANKSIIFQFYSLAAFFACHNTAEWDFIVFTAG